jgi:hypothetical protein
VGFSVVLSLPSPPLIACAVPILTVVDRLRRPVTDTTSVSLLFLSFILKNLSCMI